MKLTRIVTTEVEVTGVIKDLVMFVRYLEKRHPSAVTVGLQDANILEAADDFWRIQHGDD